MTVDVGAQALAFGQKLQDLLDGVLPVPDDAAVGARQVLVDTAPEPGRYQVRVAAPNGLVALCKNGTSIASLRITYQCTIANPSHSGEFSKLHFPVGGSRMRPCLEDFLEFVLSEFGVDRCDGADEVICEGRERWRRRQIATSVRDAPDEAVRVLQELGYTVAEPNSGPQDPNTTRLRAF